MLFSRGHWPTLFRRISGLLFWFLGVGWILGAPPVNDACPDAYVIPSNGPWPHLTPLSALTEATTLPSDPKLSCQNRLTRSVWYVFVPGQTAYYELSTCSGAPTATTEQDTVLGVFRATSCGGAFTEVSCVDDTCGFQASLVAALVGGQRYYILVWQFDEGSPTAGQVQMRVNRLQVPGNDTCANAATLQLNIPVTGSTALAVDNYRLASSDCFTGIGQTVSTAPGGDVVYRFDAPEAGAYSFRVSDYGGGNLVVYAALSCPGGSGPVTVSCVQAANRSTSAGLAEELVCVSLAAGQRVYFFVDEHSLGAGSPFQAVVTRCHPEIEPNDTPPAPALTLCEVTGWISTEGDQDWFALGSLAPGQRVFAMVEGESANTTDFELRVMTPTDVLEYDNDDNDQIFGNRAPNIAGTPVVGGETFLAVTLAQFTGVTAAGPYHLYAVVQPPYELLTPEQEPNNLPNQATRGLNNYFGGTLQGPAPSTDQDYYAFEAEAGDLVFVSLDADPTRDNTPIDARLVVLNSLGQVVVKVDDANNSSSTNRTHFSAAAVSPRSPGEAIVFRAALTGTYYVQVVIGALANSSSIGAGDYALSISRHCVAGSAGYVSTPAFGTISGTEGLLAIAVLGTPGASYRLEGSTDMVDWESVQVRTADETGAASFELVPRSATRFYRAVSP